MKIIKLGIISLVVFAILFTAISFLFPSHIRISKAIDINCSKDSLLSQLQNPVKWKEWYPGADSAALYSEAGTIKGIQTKTGMQLTIQSATDSIIMLNLKGPAMRDAGSAWIIYPSTVPNTYTIQWYTDIKLRWYPWEKFSSLLLEKRYGPPMEKGLARLKKRLERP